ncbi:MAG: hypothetical protein Q9224_006479, partial [Gallowayella concinna]
MSTSSAVGPTHEEQREALAAKLRAKTGFSSYLEYLKNESDHDYHRSLREFLTQLQAQPVVPSADGEVEHCLIIDLVKTEEWSVILRFAGQQPSGTDSRTDLIDVLHNSLTQVALRIVFWHFDLSQRQRESPGYIDILGLTLQLDPHFLRCLFVKVALWEDSDTELRPIYAKHVIIGPYVATFGHIEIQQAKSVPFVLMAGYPGGSLSRYEQKYMFDQDIRQIPAFGIRESTLLQDSTIRCSGEKSGALGNPTPETWTRWYIGILRHFIGHVGGKDVDMDSLPLAALFPVLHLSSLEARIGSRSLRSAVSRYPGGLGIEQGSMSKLYYERNFLRRWLEDTEDDMEHLR